MNTQRTLALILLVLLLAASVPGLAAPADTEVQKAFATAAFSVEYGSIDSVLRRWAAPIRYSVNGNPGEEDLETLGGFVAELAEKVQGLPDIREAASGEEANIAFYFAPLDELASLDEIYVPGNWGFFTFNYNGRQELNRGKVLIATDVTGQKDRNHLLKEEIVGLLGLTNDIDTHKDSIIYQPWTTTQDLSGLDWELLNLLYDARLEPGMDFSEAKQALGWD